VQTLLSPLTRCPCPAAPPHAARAARLPAGTYLIVKDLKQAEYVCNYILNGGDAADFLAAFHPSAMSVGFDPEKDLQLIGMANQTTMLKVRGQLGAGGCRQVHMGKCRQGMGQRAATFCTQHHSQRHLNLNSILYQCCRVRRRRLASCLRRRSCRSTGPRS
jgi:hypothetical protein